MKKSEINIIYSYFSLIFFFIIYFFNSGESIELKESLFYCCGFTLFFISFGSKELKFCFTSLIFILFLAILYNFIFYTISVLGFFLFLKNFYLLKKNLFLLLGSLALILIIGGHILCNSQSDFLFVQTLANEKTNCDLYFHSTLASNFKNFEYSTTALHSKPKFEYWALTNFLVAKLSNHLGIRSIDFYNCIYPVMIWSKLLFLLHFGLIKTLGLFYPHITNNRSVNLFASFIIANSISLLAFKPTWGPIQNYFKWEIYSVLSVPTAFYLIIISIFVVSELQQIKSKLVQFLSISIYTIISASLLCMIKLYMMHYILSFLLIFCILTEKLKFRIYFIIIFFISLIVYIYFHINNNMIKDAFMFEYFIYGKNC